MCRLYVHWGAPVPVADALVRAPHSLLDQCTNAREQSSGSENPDGWGVGWYVDGAAEPSRSRSATPMPLDRDGVAALDELIAGRFVGHVRHKSPGSPVEVAGNAPFVSGRWLFAHNGFVEGYRDGVRDELLDRLSPARREALVSDCDSEVLFALVLDRLDAGDDPRRALGAVLAPLAERGGRYNVVLTDGHRLVATRLSNTLYLRTGDDIELASEPTDDAPGWIAVADGTAIELDDDNGCEISHLLEGALP